MDPVSRAATIQAARQAFEEKEAAKSRKLEQQRMKEEERQTKRKEKHSNRASIRNEDIEEKGWEQDTSKHANSHNVPQHSHSTIQPPQNLDNWKSQSKSTWMLFLTWLRTRIFKFRRKVRSVS
jgi:hypothetical protein